MNRQSSPGDPGEGEMRMGASWTNQLTAAAIVLLMVAAWRWHGAGVVAPDRIPGIDAPSAVLLVRADDCPDRRAAMERWAGEVAPATVDGAPVRWMVGSVDGREPGLDPQMEALPRLTPDAAARAARALLRAGLDGTPALLLVDAEGQVIFADHFTPAGPGPRLALAAELVPMLAPEQPAGSSEAAPLRTTPGV